MAAGNLREQKIREWQARRLEVKAQMASQPERVLEFSRVLDLMDEEHERILSEFEGDALATDESDMPGAVRLGECAGHWIGEQLLQEAEPVPQHPNALDFKVSIRAADAEDLRKLLTLALSELDGLLHKGAPACPSGAEIARGMSGSMGAYQFVLKLSER